MMRSIMTRLSHLNSQLLRQKERVTNTITGIANRNKPDTRTRTNVSIGQDRRSALRTETKADIAFLCGNGDKQETIEANSGVLVVTVPSIQRLIDSGIQYQPPSSNASSDTHSDATGHIQTAVSLLNFQPKYVRHVLQCIYAGEISFDDSAHDGAGAIDDDDLEQDQDLPTPTLNGHDDLQQLILVANEFGFWRLKLVLEVELARKYLTEGTMIDVLIFADQHQCALLKDATMSVVTENARDLFTHPDFSKLIPHHQLMRETQTYCSGRESSNGLDEMHSPMSMMELYKALDEGEGSAQMDTYMDRATLIHFVRAMESP